MAIRERLRGIPETELSALSQNLFENWVCVESSGGMMRKGEGLETSRRSPPRVPMCQKCGPPTIRVAGGLRPVQTTVFLHRGIKFIAR